MSGRAGRGTSLVMAGVHSWEVVGAPYLELASRDRRHRYPVHRRDMQKRRVYSMQHALEEKEKMQECVERRKRKRSEIRIGMCCHGRDCQDRAELRAAAALERWRRVDCRVCASG